jgi:hypothetical protein
MDQNKTQRSATLNGMPVAIFKKISQGRRIQLPYIGGKEVLGIYLKRFFPKLLHRLVLKKRSTIIYLFFIGCRILKVNTVDNTT